MRWKLPIQSECGAVSIQCCDDPFSVDNDDDEDGGGGSDDGDYVSGGDGNYPRDSSKITKLH